MDQDSLFNSYFVPDSFKVIGEPIIQFQSIPKTKNPKSDWIFFTSKNAVHYFFEANYPIENRKIACIGEGTKRTLSKFCTNIDFIGQSKDIKKVGQDFCDVLKDNTCLFPISNISKRTVQRQLKNKEQAIDLIVYNTFPKEDIVKLHEDIVIFTSPSNAAAYLKNHVIAENQKIIAIGKSTADQLAALGTENVTTAKQVSELGMIDAMLSV